jgi:SAM-dependent methyltransferase
VDRIEAVKRRSLDLLDPPADGRVLDAGCGTGDDVLALAGRMSSSGTAIGVDRSRAMVDTARTRAVDPADDGAAVTVSVADAVGLPFHDDAFDGARSDRVLQHVAAPRCAFGELVRVTRPGGRVVVTDSDWGTLTLSAGDVDIDDRLLEPAWSCAEAAAVGRRLRGFATGAGLDDVAVETVTLSFTEFESADNVFGFSGRIDRLRAAGELSDATAQSWLSRLRDADDQFFSSLTLFTVSGTVPAAD